MSLMSASSVARQLSMDTVGSELEALAFAALVRSRPAGQSHHRAIVALDIERSTSRPDPVKAEFRTMLYELFDTALRAAGIYPCQRDQFVDRGDGLLALIHEVGQASRALLVHRVVPVLSRFLASYNAGLPPQRQLRVRVVAHEGKVHYDANGCFGEALDAAFRLLDAPRVKMALKTAPGPLLLIVSSEVYGSVVGHGYDGTGQQAFHRLVSPQIAGKRYPGWINPLPPARLTARGCDSSTCVACGHHTRMLGAHREHTTVRDGVGPDSVHKYVRSHRTRPVRPGRAAAVRPGPGGDRPGRGGAGRCCLLPVGSDQPCRCRYGTAGRPRLMSARPGWCCNASRPGCLRRCRSSSARSGRPRGAAARRGFRGPRSVPEAYQPLSMLDTKKQLSNIGEPSALRSCPGRDW